MGLLRCAFSLLLHLGRRWADWGDRLACCGSQWYVWRDLTVTVAGVPLPSLGRLSSRTNLKAASSGRHRGAAKPADDGVVEDKELTSYLAALAPDADNESTGTGKRFGEAQVIQLRMSLIANQQLKDNTTKQNNTPQTHTQKKNHEQHNWEGQASSLQDQRQQAGELTDLTDEFHFPADAFEAPAAARR